MCLVVVTLVFCGAGKFIAAHQMGVTINVILHGRVIVFMARHGGTVLSGHLSNLSLSSSVWKLVKRWTWAG
jgi:hypothetical protein